MIIASKRLESVFNMADKAKSIGDIGCDHGYISYALLESGRVERVITTDISAPSLEKAKTLLSESFDSERFSLRVGDGFSPIAEGEVDAAIIAGMGGHLIAGILEDAGKKLDALEYLIVQPMQGAEDLFEYLNAHAFQLLASDLVEERGKYYPVLKVKKGGECTVDWEHFTRFDLFLPMAERELGRLRGVEKAVETSGKRELIDRAREDVRRWEGYLEQYRNCR
ncbi:MAG: class I SAM-dependent methyltransferase [Peptoniphilus sp.]|nr:class I SAM-dependent methyltransferase [Peptoniphilus sp.]MDD7362731.1 class I SAM-dependent methyltransferase [Bacillota bacterium]MDY6044575.1 class I SAM-dependent methyltransferase [Peptoniphilus sp.]